MRKYGYLCLKEFPNGTLAQVLCTKQKNDYRVTYLILSLLSLVFLSIDTNKNHLAPSVEDGFLSLGIMAFVFARP